MSSVPLSVIITIGSRHEDLGAICEGLRRALAPIAPGYDVVFVADASGPETRQQLQRVAREFSEVRVIRLQRRMGEAAALAIGARSARGELLLTMDPYLHIAVEELPKLLAPLSNGMDLVCAWRFPRQDTGLGRLASNGFNSVARWLTKVPIHDLNCRTRAMRREVLEEMPVYGDLHRFLPVFASRRGYRWCEVQVPQQAGKREIGALAPTAYFQRLLDLLTLAFLTRFAKRPLHFFGIVGASSFAVGLVLALYLIWLKFVVNTAIGHRPMLLLAVLLIVVGIQIASIGLLGELLIFTHARDLKDYVVEEEQG